MSLPNSAACHWRTAVTGSMRTFLASAAAKRLKTPQNGQLTAAVARHWPKSRPLAVVLSLLPPQRLLV